MLECPWLLGALSLAGSHQLGTRHFNQILSEPCLLLSRPRSGERKEGRTGLPAAPAGPGRTGCPFTPRGVTPSYPTGNKRATEQHRAEFALPAKAFEYFAVVAGRKKKKKRKATSAGG